MKNLFSSVTPSVVLSTRPTDIKEVQVSPIPAWIFWKSLLCSVFVLAVYDPETSTFNTTQWSDTSGTLALKQHSLWL